MNKKLIAIIGILYANNGTKLYVPFSLDINHIIDFQESGDNTIIHTTHQHIEVKETYQQIKEKMQSLGCIFA